MTAWLKRRWRKCGLGEQMTNVLPFFCVSPSELGVEQNHVEREVNLIDNALTGTVAARKEFEVLGAVVLPVAVYVVDCFTSIKSAAKLLLHNMPVLHDVSSPGASENRNRNPHIAMAFYVALVFAALKSIVGFRRLGGHFARLIAVLLLQVHATARFAASVLFLAAVKALESVFGIGRFASAGVRAIHGAVERISAKLLFVGRQVSLHHGKGFAAFLTGKMHWNAAWCGQLLLKAMFAAASQAAVLAALIRLALVAVKGLLAVRARHLDWHCYAPLIGKNERSGAFRGCQVILAGV